MKHYWIIDDEFSQYDAEKKLLKERDPDCELRISKAINDGDVKAYADDTDALIVQISVPVDKAFLKNFKKCKVVSVYGIGYNNVDVKAARELGIALTNVAGYCAQDVADYVMAAIYRNNKPIDAYAEKLLKNGFWGAPVVDKAPPRISSEKLFIIGFGAIGRCLAQKAAGCGMQIIYYDVINTPTMQELEKRIGAKRVATIEEGLEDADVVSVHMTLNDSTKSFFNAKAFSMMKHGVQFINASRGGTVDEAALIAAVKSGRIASATLDVICNEPPKPDDPILNTKNITVTPHISYLSEDSLYELQFRAARNAADILDGKDIPEIVNR